MKKVIWEGQDAKACMHHVAQEIQNLDPGSKEAMMASITYKNVSEARERTKINWNAILGGASILVSLGTTIYCVGYSQFHVLDTKPMDVGRKASSWLNFLPKK